MRAAMTEGRSASPWLSPRGCLRYQCSLSFPFLTCRFQAQTAPWALPWKPSLTLRFSKDESSAVKVGKQKGEAYIVQCLAAT